MMKIKIINKKYPKPSKSPWLGYLIVGLLFLIMFLGLIGQYIKTTYIGNIMVILLIIWCIISIPLFFFKTYTIEQIGELLWDNENLTINYNNQIELFKLTELKRLELKYNGYKGFYLNFIRGSWVPEDGAENYFSFYYLNKKYSFEIYLENKKQKDYLKKMKVKFIW